MDIEQLESLYNHLYEYAASHKFEKQIIKAEMQFVLADDKSDIDGFTEWFIFNFREEENSLRLIDQYTDSEQDDLLRAVKASFRSYFTVAIEHNQMILKDLFTQQDYRIENCILKEDQVVSVRIVTFHHQHFIVGDMFELELTYKDAIKKYVLEQYNHYTVQNGLISMELFLESQAHLLYKVLTIVTRVDEENAFEEELTLHQATYGFICSHDMLYDRLLDLPVVILADEDEEPILRVIEEDVIIAEIEIEEKVFHILCNNESHLRKMMSVMEPIPGEDIAFLKTEIFTLEDLL